MTAKPFVKWTGGKGKLVDQILARIPDHGTYHEPFVGGGAVFFALHGRHPLQARLSDANAELIAAYRTIRQDPESLTDVLDHIAARHAADPEKTYYEYRDFSQLSILDDASLAARFIYLNKAGFNGLYRINRSGKFNVPSGKKGPRLKLYDRDNILACSAALQRVSIECRDYITASEEAQFGDSVYFDPPYAPVSATSNFTAYTANAFNAADQEHLRDTALKLKRRGVCVLLSNSTAPLIRELYSGPDWTVEEVEVRRGGGAAAESRKNVAELLIS